MLLPVSYSNLSSLGNLRLTGFVGAIAGGEDSIRTIFNLAQEGVVTDPSGKKAFQVCFHFSDLVLNDEILTNAFVVCAIL